MDLARVDVEVEVDAFDVEEGMGSPLDAGTGIRLAEWCGKDCLYVDESLAALLLLSPIVDPSPASFSSTCPLREDDGCCLNGRARDRLQRGGIAMSAICI